MFVDTTGDCGE